MAKVVVVGALSLWSMLSQAQVASVPPENPSIADSVPVPYFPPPLLDRPPAPKPFARRVRSIPTLNLNQELFEKIHSQGVPEHALHKIFDTLIKQSGQAFLVDAYFCKDRGTAEVRPCDDEERVPYAKSLTLKAHEYAAVVDFTRPSTERRFFLIRMTDGKVERFYASHGKGSGLTEVAWKFSNQKDSQQTSLGLYMTGEIYQGGYGNTLRMYGLEKSNDQAFNRDIVLHGAYYADEDFLSVKNDLTGLPYGRLGLSWGCPAVALPVARRIIPLLADGALMYHEHEKLAEEALARSGREVQGEKPPPPPTAKPREEKPSVAPKVKPVVGSKK